MGVTAADVQGAIRRVPDDYQEERGDVRQV